MSVGAICTREFGTVSPDEALATAAERMIAHGAEVLVVEDGDRRLLGLLTERQILTCVLGEGIDRRVARVREAMVAPAPTVRGDDSAEVALARMLDSGTRWLVVTNRLEHAVGLLSVDQLLRLFLAEITAVASLLHDVDWKSGLASTDSHAGG